MGGQVVDLEKERMVRRGREPWCTKQELAEHLGLRALGRVARP